MNSDIPRRKGQPLSDFDRGKIIAFYECDLSKRVICERTDYSYYAVSKTIKEYNEQQKLEKEQLKKCGSKYKDRFTTRIKLSLKRFPNQPLSYHLEQIRMEGTSVSLSSLDNFIKEMGFDRSYS